MSLTIQKIYGDIGERFAADYLKAHGFESCRADKIECLGHSFLSGKNRLFDCSVSDLIEISKACKQKFLCRVKNLPCKNKAKSFYKFNPQAPDHFSPTHDGRFSPFCAFKLSYTSILDHCDNSSFEGAALFLRRYLQIHKYILNYYDSTCKMWPLPSEKKERKKWHDYWAGHPGRLDFFALKDGKFYCLDAKVNSSGLSKWQSIRLAWMQQFGYFCGVIRIRFEVEDKSWLAEQFERGAFDVILKALKSTAEMEEFDPKQMPDEYRKDIPTPKIVRSYLKMGLHWFDPNAEWMYL
ncbi:MAG: hypothetical protein WCJ71_08850 [Candidatus Omnitrophota bacterium]